MAPLPERCWCSDGRRASLDADDHYCCDLAIRCPPPRGPLRSRTHYSCRERRWYKLRRARMGRSRLCGIRVRSARWGCRTACRRMSAADAGSETSRMIVAGRDGGGGTVRRSRCAVPWLVSMLLLSVAPWAWAVCDDDMDDALWDTFEACRTYEGTQDFVKQCPDSDRVKEARACLERWDAEAAEWDRVGGCTDRGQVEAFVEKHPKGRFTEQARACLAKLDPAQVVLPDGFTLADWALLAEERLREGEHARLLAEANAHLRRYGRLGVVEEVRERAIAGLVSGIRVTTAEEARSGLKRIARVEASAGERAELARLRARAHELLGDWESAAGAYVQWLRLAPQTHPERVEVVRALRGLRDRLAQHERFAELVGREASAAAVDEETGWTDLHYAAVLNLPAVTKALLEAGVAVDVRLRDDGKRFDGRLTAILNTWGHGWDNWGWGGGQTALHFSSLKGAREVVELLLDRGADINAQDDTGNAPLHYCSAFCSSTDSLEVAQLLLDRGADIEAKNNGDEMPLHWAAYRNALDVVQLLLDRGADANAERYKDGGSTLFSMYGKTPLHYPNVSIN